MRNYLLAIIILISLFFNSSFYSKEVTKAGIENHFVFINTHLKLVIKEKCTENCYQVFDIEKEVNKVNNILAGSHLVVGSGFIYDNINTTKIITANHLCEKAKKYIDYRSEFNNTKIELLQTLVQSKDLDVIDAIQITNVYDLMPVITIQDFYGNQYMYNKILKQDKGKDLCILESNDIFGIPVKINNRNCIYGEEVINISSSDGLYFPNAVPYYTGTYSGHIKNTKFKVFDDNVEVGIYTIDISQGASGSAVFSKKTKKLCGNINASMKKAKVSLGSTNNSIKEFINGDAGSRTQVQK